ncbi:endonuclease/exonuclease/phosphatase family protein [Nocardioides sp. PD653]|uniref:endonuclease/exonuclease/phosphatase family protein n=1 Tax=Nocardioides sp. PD653 TaxID=393303 RepID=UPI001F624B36|nr:endonuclease/exonuclease/phosphatase family protein [Nocardioides sp. PD653]
MSQGTGGSFGIGTLNWRGASHYSSNPHPGERPYAERVPNMVAKIGASGASIIGFQEFEPQQAKAFLEATDGAWAIVKGKNGSGEPATANAIAYQPGVWAVVEVRYVSIRYGRPMIKIPLVRFTSTSGGGTGLGSIWVLNTHNPAGAVGGTKAMRAAAVRAEATALQHLQTSEPGMPLFLTGDMNDKTRFKRLFLSLASGWSPANPTDQQIDWIMGSPAAIFSGTVVDQSTNDGAHDYTDHPFVHTTAQLATGTTDGEPGTAGAAEQGRSGSGTVLGQMPTEIAASPGGPVTGSITIASANFKWAAEKGLHAINGAAHPDFITLNEIWTYPTAKLSGILPGYGAYKDPAKTGDGNTSQSINNAIMWRTEAWTMLDGGRVKIVDKDQTVFNGKNVQWDRYATWGSFQRNTDGAVVSVIATHQMTNAYRVRRQWGNPPMTRPEQYGLGMDYLIDLTNVLAPYGPVLLGGDMNSHPDDGPNAAAPRMEAAGFNWTKDSGVIYQFYKAPVAAQRTWELSTSAVGSDHPALLTTLAMNDAGPGSSTPTGQESSGCPPCPDFGNLGTVLLQNVSTPGNTNAAQTAAAVAYQAGFRGEDLVTAVAIAGVESTWNPQATNGSHFGLWQISAQHKGKVAGGNTREDIFDPLLNARYAFALYSARPGSGEAKFADWIPFEKTDYHQFLDQARQAVAATAGGASSSNTACTASPIQVAGELSAALSARVDVMLKTPNGLCQLSWTSAAPCTYKNQCPKVVDAVYGGPGVGRGYGNGEDVAQGIINAGLAQAHGTGLDPLPPAGAVISYNRGDGRGHVAIYVGNGKIFGNDYGCAANGVYGCVGFADVHAPAGSVTWALPKQAFDLGGMPAAAA